MDRKTYLRALLAAVALATAATVHPANTAAQQATTPTPRLRLEPYAGILLHGTHRTTATGNSERVWNPGPTAGLRASYGVSPRIRLSGHVGYADLTELFRSGTEQAHFTFRSNQILAAAGVEMEPVQGRTSASIGLEVGSVLQEAEIEGSFGNPPPEFNPANGYAASIVAVPSLAVRHAISPRWEIGVALQDYVFVDRMPPGQSFALTAGVSFGVR